MAEIEFRDGKREVPDHVGDLLSGVKTHTMTYEEAIRAGERMRLGEHVYRAQQDIIRAHFGKGSP